jgi:hypothetical protein
MNEIKKILLQTLKNNDELYSSKKMMTFISFNLCVLMAIIDQFTRYKLNESVFNSFLLISTGQSILSLVGNKISLDKEKKSENP